MSAAFAWLRTGCLLILIATLVACCETHTLAAEADEAAVEETEVLDSDDAAALEQVKKQPATHRQTAIISPTESGSALKSFVVAPDGNIMALVQIGVASGEHSMGLSSALSALAGKSDKASEGKPAGPACEVRTFSPDGKRIGAWPVNFMAQTMGLSSDSHLYVAGDGRVARYSLEGTELAIVDSPQVTLIEKDSDGLREAAEAQIIEDAENVKQTVDAFQKQRDEIAAQIEKKPDKRKELQLKRLDAQIKQLTPEQDVDKVIVQITKRLKVVNAIAASDTEVFITCPQTKGYGYSVWRTDLDFANASCIVTGLSGCCGQMDVCCAQGDLWVAENSRHRVVRYNREGKRLAAFGKTGRDGIGEAFGGCCNPMNLCFDRAGDLLASESNGQVKRFTAKGKYIDVAGVAQVAPGCKNSAVKISPDGEHIYYIDINRSKILVLARNEPKAKAGD